MKKFIYFPFKRNHLNSPNYELNKTKSYYSTFFIASGRIFRNFQFSFSRCVVSAEEILLKAELSILDKDRKKNHQGPGKEIDEYANLKNFVCTKKGLI